MPVNRSPINLVSKQKKAEEYFKAEYLAPERFSSIGWQFKFAMETRGDCLLNIGVGSGLLEQLLQANQKTIYNLDIDPSLSPSAVGSILTLPFGDRSFDTVMAFQVLEHLPLDLLGQILVEFKRTARKAVLISVPNPTNADKIPEFHLTSPTTWVFRSRIKIIFKQDQQAENYTIFPEHFWEIGCNGVRVDDILAAATDAGLKLSSDFRNPCFPYHHFFSFWVSP